LVAAGKTSG